MKFVTLGLLILTPGVVLGLRADERAPDATAAALAGGGNQAPVCIAGGPSFVACNENVVFVPLDGSRSYDPDGDDLTYEWQVGCPGTMLTDPTSVKTQLVVDTSQVCGATCAVRLKVRDGHTLTVCRVEIHFDAIQLYLDIEPGLCPNPIDVDGAAASASPFALFPISLTSAKDWDPGTVRQETLEITRRDEGFLNGGHDEPDVIEIEDDMTPFKGEPCACTPRSGDGVLDVSMGFFTHQLITNLSLDAEPPGTAVVLRMTGVFQNGDLFYADDCVLID